MPEQDVQRRRGETASQKKARGKEVGRAEAQTEAEKREAAHAPWRARWEKETGKKYGIATASEYNEWLAKQRAEAEKKKKRGQTAGKQGEALSKKKEE